MTETKPSAVLVKEKGSTRWKIELRDLKAFRQTLGCDVINAFCRCFVHDDRLTSLLSFAYLNQQHHEETSPGFTRNLQTMAWFTVGTLRELARAIRDLRSALAKSGNLDPQSGPWQALRAFEHRWADDAFFREMRNTIAFHVDSGVIETGLAAMEADGNAILCEGEGQKVDRSSMCLGLEAFLRGCDKNLSDFRLFLTRVRLDQTIATQIQEAFFLALESKGIPRQEVEE
jgi:hypothetical protein